MKKHHNKISVGNIFGHFSSMIKRSFFYSAVSSNSVSVKDSIILNKVSNIPFKKYFFDPVKGFLTKTIDNSFIVRKLSLFYEFLLTMSLRCYGWCITSFVLMTLLVSFMKNTISENIVLNSAVVLFAVIPMLFSSKNIASSVCESGFLSSVFVKYLHCEKLITYKKRESHGNISGALIVGIFSGFFTLAFTRSEIVFFVSMLIVTAIFMCRPETAALSISLCLPFASRSLMTFLASIALFSYLVKVIRGKRNLYLKLHDIPVLLFLASFLFIPAQNFSWMDIIPFILLYFLFSGMMRKKDLLIKCIKNLFVSTSLYAAYNIASYFWEYRTISFDLFFTDQIRKSSFFTNTAALSVLYACAFIFAFFLLKSKEENKRIVIIGVFLNFIALCFCGAELTALSCIVALITIFLVLSQNKITAVFFSLALIFVAYDFFSAFSNTVNGIYVASDLLIKYKNHFLFGTSNSELIYEAEGIANAGNLWVQLSFWGGLLIMLLVFVLSFIFLRNVSLSHRYNNEIEVKSISVALFSVILVYIISSFGCFSWGDYRVFTLFWILGGLSSAYRRIVENDKLIKSVTKIY